jgi:prevent-host-death family protein
MAETQSVGQVRLDEREGQYLRRAKTRLSALVDRAEAGEEIIIARGGRPAARLVPIRPPAVKRKPGRLRGRIRIGRDFDAPLPAGLFDDDER